MEQTKFDVFISYSRKDYVDENKRIIPGNIVSRIKEALTDAGISYWFDEEGINHGDKFAKLIVRNIKASRIFLFISTENSNSSEWTGREIATAHMMKKRIIPVRVDDSAYHEDVMFYISILDYVDYKSNPDKGIKDLIKAIKAYLAEEQEAERRQLVAEEERRKQKEDLIRRQRLMDSLKAEIKQTENDCTQLEEQMLLKKHEFESVRSNLNQKRERLDEQKRQLNAILFDDNKQNNVIVSNSDDDLESEISTDIISWHHPLGVEEKTSGLSEDNQISLEISGTDVVPVDVDGDSSFDIMVTDKNQNGAIDQDEVVDISDSISMEDFERTIRNSFDYAELPDDIFDESNDLFDESTIPQPPPECSREGSLNRRDQADVFATTACGPISDTKKSPKTYMPDVEDTYNDYESLKRSIWLKIFGRKKNYVLEDVVYSSIFAPAEVRPKSHMLVQVYLHLFEETEKIKTLAQESDKNAERRDYIPLQCKLKKGDKVDVQLNIYGEKLLMSDKKSVVWQGSFTKCSFDYFVPKDIDVDALSCVAFLSVNSVPVGEMRFITRIVKSPRKLNPEIIAHKYNKVFISYSHQDESKVKFLHEGLELGSVPHFFDRKYLKAGDIFPRVIQDYINSADLFVLCWSENAAQREYVKKERIQALERAYPKVLDGELSIYPMSIEPRAELPSDMKDNYHFGEI